MANIESGFNGIQKQGDPDNLLDKLDSSICEKVNGIMADYPEVSLFDAIEYAIDETERGIKHKPLTIKGTSDEIRLKQAEYARVRDEGETTPQSLESKHGLELTTAIVEIASIFNHAGVNWKLDGALNISLQEISDGKKEYFRMHGDIDIDIVGDLTGEQLSKLLINFKNNNAPYGYGAFVHDEKLNQSELIQKRGYLATEFVKGKIPDQGLRLFKLNSDGNPYFKAGEILIDLYCSSGRHQSITGYELPQKWQTAKKEVILDGAKIYLDHPQSILYHKFIAGRKRDFIDIVYMVEGGQITSRDMVEVGNVIEQDIKSGALHADQQQVFEKMLKRAKEWEKNKQTERVNLAQSLISASGGIIDNSTAPYKSFDPNKFDRFFVRKGSLPNEDVVFKVGKKSEEKVINQESKNLQLIQAAKVKPGQSLDVHFVRQIGALFSDENMVGLATEYLEDDPELKQKLVNDPFGKIINKVIENLQKLEISEDVKQSGLEICDGTKIYQGIKSNIEKAVKCKLLDKGTATNLSRVLYDARQRLTNDNLVFCHGDCHGGNIFLKKINNKIDISLLDFEELKISNPYYDWCRTLNKSTLWQNLAAENPKHYQDVKFDEQEIIGKITQGDLRKILSFKFTKIYDILTEIPLDEIDNDTFAFTQKENIYIEMLKKEIDEILIKNCFEEN